MLRLVATVALPLWVVLAPIADASEPGSRIWDPDLKRYLTEEEVGRTEVYLTTEQAVSRSGSAGNSPKRASAPSRRKPTARLTATPSFRRPSASTGPSPTSSA